MGGVPLLYYGPEIPRDPYLLLSISFFRFQFSFACFDQATAIAHGYIPTGWKAVVYCFSVSGSMT